MANTDEYEQAFTRYFLAHAKKEEAVPVVYDRMWRKLGKTLRRELARTGLSQVPPKRIGIFGADRWLYGTRGGPFDDLLSEAHTFLVDKKRFENQLLPKLQSEGANVDGSVVLMLRDFVKRRRRDHDPLGYAVYGSILRVLRQCVAAEELAVVSGPSEVRSDTVLGLRPEGDVGPVADRDALRAAVAGWTRELLPGLVTAQRGGRTPVHRTLRRLIERLVAHDVSVFRAGDLVQALQDQVRAVWEDMSSDADDAGSRDARWFDLPERLARQVRAERFGALIDCVDRQLHALTVRLEERRRLETLWRFLQVSSQDDAPLPAQRPLATMLGIPRGAVRRLFDRVAELTEICLASFEGVGERSVAHG